MKSHITPRYAERRERYRDRFPPAHAFLRALEQHPGDGLWLSTSTNAHLYKGPSFLAYIVLSDASYAPPTLTLSPHFNNRIAEGATDAAGMLFPDAVQQVLHRHSSAPVTWWTSLTESRIELRCETPSAFFDDLLAVIRGLPVETSTAVANVRLTRSAE